jgi:hypothetical protein
VTVKDIAAVKEIPIDPNLCAYPDDDEHLWMLCDDRATREGILAGLQWLKETSDRGFRSHDRRSGYNV